MPALPYINTYIPPRPFHIFQDKMSFFAKEYFLPRFALFSYVSNIIGLQLALKRQEQFLSPFRAPLDPNLRT